jgi:preprotein translocase subunit SecY
MNAASRERAPSAQETFTKMAQTAGLRGRVLVTIGLLILARLGVYLPLPGINRTRFAEALDGNAAIGFLDLFSGGGISAVGIFALGILPYINASIIIQLLTTALPALEKLQKEEGEAGRRKISQITRYVALGWGLIQSIGIATWLNNGLGKDGLHFANSPGPLFLVTSSIALIAGSMFIMWISELITERGIGNGASLLIFINIVAVFPKSLIDTFDQAKTGGNQVLVNALILIAVFLVTIVCIVFIQEGSRQIPIISAKRQVGRRLYRERTSYLPLRLIQGGVMPIIFASSVLALPQGLAQFTSPGAGTTPNQFMSALHSGANTVANAMRPDSSQPWIHLVVYMVLIIFFSYFYSTLVVNPVDMSQNLKKMGASIPGIRPGQATSSYIEGVLNRLTILGAFFLGAVAIIPGIIESSLHITTFKGFGATSLLILVGVAIETAKQIQTYVISQRYEGMVKE